MMNLIPHSRIIFRFAAVANLFGAALALAAMPLHVQMFYGLDISALAVREPHAVALLRFYHYNFWAIVLVMGASYWHIANDPPTNRPLMLVGAVGKLTVAVSWALMFAAGTAQILVLAGVLYDGLFGLLFLIVYQKIRQAEVNSKA
jgi:hypothetical protein